MGGRVGEIGRRHSTPIGTIPARPRRRGARGGRRPHWVGSGRPVRVTPPPISKEPSMVDARLVPEPTVLMLFGATGDLAHRLVLPALFRLAQDGLLPEDWRIVGNGRGDVSHEDFQERVRKSLEEFGPKPEDGPWEEFRDRLRFAGGGFEASDPGSLLDVLHEAEEELGGQPAAGPLLRRAARRLRRAHRGHRRARSGRAVPGRLREAVRHLHGVLRGRSTRPPTASSTRTRSTGSTTSSARRPPRTIHVLRFGNGLFAGPGTATTSTASRSTCPRPSTSGMRAGLLRGHRRHARHAGHPPVPAGR